VFTKKCTCSIRSRSPSRSRLRNYKVSTSLFTDSTEADHALSSHLAEVACLLPILLTLSSSSHRSSASELQSALTAFESFLVSLIDRIWLPREQEWKAEQVEEQQIRDKGDTSLLAEWEARPKPIEGEVETKRVERPTLAKVKWRVGMLSTGES